MTKGLSFSFLLLGLSTLSLAGGCTASLDGDDDSLGGAGGSAGTGAGGASQSTGGAAGAGAENPPSPEVERCDTLYQTFESQGDPKYEADVLPILRTSCNMSICHGGDPEKAQSGLWLGRLEDEEMTKDEIAFSYESLLDIQSRAIPELALVRKDRPRDSVLMLKLDDCFEHPSLDCALDDPGLGPCGDPMPVLADPLSEETRSLIRSWIANGAKK